MYTVFSSDIIKSIELTKKGKAGNCIAMNRISKLGIIFLVIGVYVQSPLNQQIAAETITKAKMNDINVVSEKIAAKNYRFDINNQNDYKITLNDTEVDAYVIQSLQTLEVQCVEAINLFQLWEDKAVIGIEYGIIETAKDNILETLEQESETESSSWKKVLTTEDVEKEDVLGHCVMMMTLDEDNIFWRINNQNGSYGVGAGPYIIPSGVLELLPRKIEQFLGINHYKEEEAGVFHGFFFFTPDVQQDKVPSWIKKELSFQTLGLSNKIKRMLFKNNESSAILEIKANYKFTLPLELYSTSKDSKNILRNKKIQGFLTLQFMYQIQR